MAVAQIVLQLAVLSFGEVPVGSSVTLPLTVQNVGSAPLNISALTLEAEVSSGFALRNVPAEAVGPVNSQLRIASHAVNGA